MATKKKIPMRMCVGCREMRPKKELVRVVRNNEGLVSIDLKGKAAGRGAYICPKADCLQLAKKSRALERAFEQKMEAAIYEQIEKELFASGLIAAMQPAGIPLAGEKGQIGDE